MGKGQHSPNSKCLCRKIFSNPCPICKLKSTHVLAQEKSKPMAEMTPPTKVLADPIPAKASPKVERQKPKLEAQLTKPIRTASLERENHAFSDYINRAKIRIRAMSNVGNEKTASGSDDAYDTKKEDKTKDTFSDYINRAKLKIRKISSFGSRNGFSFKRE